MGKKTEALKLALEAAEVLETLFKQAEAMHEEVTGGVNVHCQITVADLSKGLYAAAAIREALAEQPAQQQEPVACPTCGEVEPRTGSCGTSPNDKRALCNRALSQPDQQEPAASVTYKEVADAMNALYKGDIIQMQIAEMVENKRLYTSLPKHKPLTDEEIADLWNAQIFNITDLRLAKDFVREIEAEHGIKE